MKKDLLLIFGLFLGLTIIEGALFIFNQPRFYKTHSHPSQFAFIFPDSENFVYFNIPSSATRFIYDGNPRSYFGKNNEIDHITNSSGFRGGEFSIQKPEDTFRIVFLGDSFTFGEGVWFKDIYPQRVVSMLSKKIREIRDEV